MKNIEQVIEEYLTGCTSELQFIASWNENIIRKEPYNWSIITLFQLIKKSEMSGLLFGLFTWLERVIKLKGVDYFYYGMEKKEKEMLRSKINFFLDAVEVDLDIDQFSNKFPNMYQLLFVDRSKSEEI